VPLATASVYPESMAVPPDGKNLYVGDDIEGTAVEQFTIGSGGKVMAMTPGYVGTSDVSHLVVSPDGKSVYATVPNTGTVRYSVGAGGALTLTSDVADTGPYAGGIAISPDQGPTAEFVDSPAAPGHATAFSGAASHDPDGKIARYAWAFGDGKSATTTSPTVRHVYARAGHYVVTLTVTDNDGASTQQVFTGHQVLLNGGPAARTTRTVVIVAPPKLTALKIQPDRFKVGSAGHGGATVSYRVAGSGKVTLTIARRTGSETVPSKPGLDQFHFSGRWGGKALPAGDYRLKLEPFAGMVAGQAQAATFTIVR
jgi:PKD domain